MNQAYIENYSSNSTDIMTWDDVSSFVFTIKHGFKTNPKSTVTWEEDFQTITDNTYAAADIDTWQMLTITPDLLANGVVKFNINDGTNDYETNEFDMDGLTTLRLWVYMTGSGLTLQSGVDIFVQAV